VYQSQAFQMGHGVIVQVWTTASSSACMRLAMDPRDQQSFISQYILPAVMHF
jgi:hypothetical protein